MAHQCVHCGRICPPGSREIIDGCKNCSGHFFFYIREDQLKKQENLNVVEEIPKEDKKQIEKDIREMAGIEKEDSPVILDFESVRAAGPGKYEIDVVKLFKKDRPLIYKLEEGKYIIDLATTLSGSAKELNEAKEK
jgi:uncharacterized protein